LSAYPFSGLTVSPASIPETPSHSFVLSEKNPSLLPENVIPFEQVQPISRFPGSNMKSDLLEKASEIVSDPLVLVNLVSQRVKQLNSGRSPLIATRPSMGVADIALTEIIEGKIKLIQREAP
jgi:DNA-directed RNA polymerase subunit omega